jgi:hypothetical protein
MILNMSYFIDCKKYFKCQNRLVVSTCPEGEIFYESFKTCVPNGFAECDSKNG